MSMVNKYAVAVGINNYPGTGSDLRGCVNDAIDWTDHLSSLGYKVLTLTDEQATKTAVTSALREMMAMARYRDKVVFTYSGHGSWVPDRGGDEADSRDEVLVLHDFDRGGLLSDDEMNTIFSNRRFGVKPTVISDSCHSGTLTDVRGLEAVRTLKHSVVDAAPRFLSPSHFLASEDVPAALEVESKAPRGASRPTTALLSGCDDPEFSYDAYIDGRYRGAFTAAALKTWVPGITLRKWHEAIRLYLPSNQYPQSPQIGATYPQRFWTL